MSGKFKRNMISSQVISDANIKADLKNSGKWTDKIVILHTGLAFRIYQKLIVFLKTFSCFVYSYYAGYRVSDEMSFRQIWWMEAIFLFDFLLNFLVTFPGNGEMKGSEGKPETDLKKIRQNYYE